jgi:8-oxo-dGTP diphosphatase
LSRPHLLVAAAALIDPDNRVLVTQRPPGGPLAGLWEFPGGKVEPGETPEAALRREISEELGIALCCVAPAGFATHAYADFDLTILLWMGREWEGWPAGPAMRWVRVSDLWQLAMPPADGPLIAQLAARL